MRQPDIQGDRIVFVYGADLWSVSREGGVATRLTSHEGIERFPKFSPDGKSVAFTAQYDGNTDAYVMPADGGEPRRLTWHPGLDQVAEWYPDGRGVLLRSARASSIARYDRFFRVPAEGGFEEPLALPTGGYATFSPDGSQIAFVSPSYDNRTWKRYTGGFAAEIWLYDFKANASEKLTSWEGADEWPMWHGRTIYYCSDRAPHANLWAYDIDEKTHRQVTSFGDYDVKWPSIGSDAIVFENGGYLYVMDLPSETTHKLQVLVPSDKPDARPEYRDVAHWIEGADLSPTAKRVVFAARGELFTAPAEKGDVRNLTRTPGVRERDPAWSPDGKWIAYLSDRTGEYELYVIGSDGKAPERQVTRGGQTYRFEPRWSPDSKKLAFADKTCTLWWCDVATGKLTRIAHSDYGQIRSFDWSGDSRWIAFEEPNANYLTARIRLYGLDGGRIAEVSEGPWDDRTPAFDPDGRWLYFVSRRHLGIEAFAFDTLLPLAATDGIYAVALRADVPSPVAPKSDEESVVEPDKDGAKDKKRKDAKGDSDKPGAVAPWKVDLDGLAGRVAAMPVDPGRYRALRPFKDKLLYVSVDRPDPQAEGGNEGRASLHAFDLEKGEDTTILSDVDPFMVASRDGSKLLYSNEDVYGIVETDGEKKPGDGKLPGDPLMATVDPPAEWKQMFEEAWRLERDFYYDPAMGGVDWKAIGERYRQLVPYVAHRADLNYILGELIGELSTSHTYVGGGDAPQAAQVDVGLLGADFELDSRSGLYRFKTLYRASDWNSEVVAPLGAPGVGVREGDLLLAVNGQPVRAPRNVYAAFEGTSGKRTSITVGSTANDPKPRTYEVEPIGNEVTLRYTAWVAANRKKVAEATGGRVGYVHIPDTQFDGISEFTKQVYPQSGMDGMIVDERFNSGGFIPDAFVERLARKPMAYWSNRDGVDFQTPASSIAGPRCILINQYAGSGGDAFPHYFRLQGLGPVIGMRTWGGLVGISQDLPLVDGGVVTMPDFGMWDAKSGQWIIENRGVEPDLEIENAPHEMVAGRDPQLEAGIRYCLEQLEQNPVKRPARPAYKVRR
jgi:tricorn protease